MSKKRVVVYRSQGIGLGGILTIMFVILKVTGHITWSWWWVFSPVWLPMAIVLGIMGAGLIVAAVVMGIAMLIDTLS